MVGLLTGLQVILARILAIRLPASRISFQFVAQAVTGAMFGPVYGAISAASADVIGSVMFPTQVGFFPGFMLTAGICGAIYGFFLHKKPRKLLNISMAVICASILQLVLDSIWYYMLLDIGFFGILSARIPLFIFRIPMQIAVLWIFFKFIMNKLKVRY